MSLLSWGKPVIVVKSEEEGALYRKLNTPVDDSTNLETTEGDKTEAKIEGGEIEDVRYDKSTYKLSMQIRLKKGDKFPFSNKDGVINGSYAVWVQPEDKEAFGIQMLKTHVSIKTSYTAADGILCDIAFDALSPDANTEQCQFGVVDFTESEGKVTAVQFTAATSESEIAEA